MADEPAKLTCKSITVKVDSLRLLLNVGTCKAFARVSFVTDVGTITIDNFRLLESKNGTQFVVPPSHKKGDKYYDDVEVTDDLLEFLNGAVKKGYAECKK